MTLNPNVCASTSNRARALVKRHNNSQFLKDQDLDFSVIWDYLNILMNVFLITSSPTKTKFLLLHKKQQEIKSGGQHYWFDNSAVSPLKIEHLNKQELCMFSLLDLIQFRFVDFPNDLCFIASLICFPLPKWFPGYPTWHPTCRPRARMANEESERDFKNERAKRQRFPFSLFILSILSFIPCQKIDLQD